MVYPGSMAGEHRHVLVPQSVLVRRRRRSQSRAVGASSSRRRESLEGGGTSSNCSHQQTHSFSTSRSSRAFSRSGSTSSDDDFWPRRTSPSSSSSSSSSSSGGSSTGLVSARRSLRLAFHGWRGRERGERADVVGVQSALTRRAGGGGGENHGRRNSLFLSLVDSEGSSRSRSTEHFLEAPESSPGAMLPGVEVARRRRVRIAETYEGGGHVAGQEASYGSRSSRSGVTVAHHHHHYHHHHHHHVHHQASRNASRPGTPRPGNLVRRMHDFLHDHRAGRSPFEHFSSSSSTDRANTVDGSVNPHTAHRRGHTHRSSEGESRIAPLSSLWRRQSSDSSSNLRGAALEARNRLDERLRAAAHASHSRRSWQAVQSTYDMNLLFSDDEEDNLWSDDDGWETSLHEWLAAWAPSAVEERWNRVESSSSGRASSSRNPAFKPRPSEGLSKAAIIALPRHVVGSSRTSGGGNRNKMEQEDCPVCLEGFVAGQSVMALPCNHRFHPECLTPWLANHGQCPYCRADIVKDTDSSPEQKGSGGLMGGSEELLSWVEAIERGMDRLSYS